MIKVILILFTIAFTFVLIVLAIAAFGNGIFRKNGNRQ